MFPFASQVTSHPVLIAVDDFNAFSAGTDYHESLGPRQRRNIPAAELRLAAALSDLGAPMAYGARVAATSGSIGVSPRVIAGGTAGKKVPEGCRRAVARYTLAEAEAMLDHYDRNFLIEFELEAADVAYFRMLCGGNGRELRRLAQTSLLGDEDEARLKFEDPSAPPGGDSDERDDREFDEAEGEDEASDVCVCGGVMDRLDRSRAVRWRHCLGLPPLIALSSLSRARSRLPDVRTTTTTRGRLRPRAETPGGPSASSSRLPLLLVGSLDPCRGLEDFMDQWLLGPVGTFSYWSRLFCENLRPALRCLTCSKAAQACRGPFEPPSCSLVGGGEKEGWGAP